MPFALPDVVWNAGVYAEAVWDGRRVCNGAFTATGKNAFFG